MSVEASIKCHCRGFCQLEQEIGLDYDSRLYCKKHEVPSNYSKLPVKEQEQIDKDYLMFEQDNTNHQYER